MKKRIWIFCFLLALCCGCSNTSGKGSGAKEEDTVLELTWHMGYVGSGEHSKYPNQLVEGKSGSNFSYTDVFTVKTAGTTLTFTDDKANSGGDIKYTPSTVYVISTWREENGEWVLDDYGANYAGSDSEKSEILTSFEDDIATYSYTTSVDNEHLRICYRSGEMPGFVPEAYPVVTAKQLGQSGTAAKKYELVTWLENSAEEFYAKGLTGLTVNAIGDSYFAGNGLQENYVWINLLARKYNMNMNNFGINGSTMSNALTKYHPICDRYQDMPEADIILVEGGRNDFNQKVPIGAADSRDTTTYTGALNVILDGLQAKYPNAMIVCVTPWNFKNKDGYTLTYKDYCTAMKEAAQAHGVYCIEACDPDISGVDMESSVFRSKYCMDVEDVSHLNLEGMKLVMSKFEKIIAEYWEDKNIEGNGR